LARLPNHLGVERRRSIHSFLDRLRTFWTWGNFDNLLLLRSGNDNGLDDLGFNVDLMLLFVTAALVVDLLVVKLQLLVRVISALRQHLDFHVLDPIWQRLFVVLHLGFCLFGLLVCWGHFQRQLIFIALIEIIFGNFFLFLNGLLYYLYRFFFHFYFYFLCFSHDLLFSELSLIFIRSFDNLCYFRFCLCLFLYFYFLFLILSLFFSIFFSFLLLEKFSDSLFAIELRETKTILLLFCLLRIVAVNNKHRRHEIVFLLRSVFVLHASKEDALVDRLVRWLDIVNEIASAPKVFVLAVQEHVKSNQLLGWVFGDLSDQLVMLLQLRVDQEPVKLAGHACWVVVRLRVVHLRASVDHARLLHLRLLLALARNYYWFSGLSFLLLVWVNFIFDFIGHLEFVLANKFRRPVVKVAFLNIWLGLVRSHQPCLPQKLLLVKHVGLVLP
jgi:hypothetical protein